MGCGSSTVSTVGADPSAFGEKTPFILIAKIKCKSGADETAYLEIAATADAAVMSSEPGMLHHSFDRLDGKEFDFCWSEASGPVR